MGLLLAAALTLGPLASAGSGAPGEVPAGVPAVGGNAREQANAEIEALYAKSPPVGYAFLVESSVEMQPVAMDLRASIADLIEVLPAGDVIELIVFHVRPWVALPPTVITEAERASIVDRVRTLEVPTGYDRDLGAGLDQLATDLARTGAPEFQHAFVFSTFCHAPSVASAWSSGGRGCSAVRNATSIGSRLASQKGEGRLVTRLFPIVAPPVQVDAQGVDTAVRELGGVVTTDAPSTWLASWRGRRVAERIAPIVLHDTRSTNLVASVKQAPTSESPTAVIELSSTARLLSLRLDHPMVKGSTATLPESILLAPTATVEVPVTVPRGPISFFPRTDTVDVSLTVEADGVLLPDGVLKIYGYEGVRKGLRASVTVPVERHYGLSHLQGLLLLGIIFAVSGVLAVLVRGRMMPLRLGGTLAWRVRGGERRQLDVAERTEAALSVSADGAVSLGKSEGAAVVLRVRRPVWRMYGEVVVRASGVEINGKPAAIGVHPVVPGAVSLRIGDTRLTWE